jgi:hypothetical protein
MGIDLKKMKAKLAALQNKGGGKTNFWRPEEGTSYSIRVVPTSDGDPFKEFYFHYEIGKGSILCPKKNHGEECAICAFASKLYKEGTEESNKMAKKFLARQRFFAPVVVRGEEKDGVKLWGFGKNVYQDLINLVLNPDYGDITDPENGTDLSLMSTKVPGASFPTTKLTPARKTSKLCQGSSEECKELLDSVPNFDDAFERKTSAEVEAILTEHMAGGSESDADAEASSKETVKYGKGSKSTSAVDEAFKSLMS